MAQKAGEIGALIPEGLRNTTPAKVRDDVQWNDLLKTLSAGRMRANLLDGSILTLGRDSELRVLQHDAASQQTSLELNYGRMRNRAITLTKPGARYEVTTPTAVIGVIGTDFFVYATQDLTIVIVYSGVVLVTPRGAAASSGQQPVRVEAGQMVTVGPNGIGTPHPTPEHMARESMDDTTVEEAVTREAVPKAPRGGCYTPAAEIAFGFQFNKNSIEISPGSTETFNLYGTTFTGGGYINQWIGIVGEVSNTYDTSGTVMTTFMGGPRFSFCGPKNLRFFAQTLHGGVKQNQGSGYSLTVGGGVDWFLSDRFGVRIVQADFHRMKITEEISPGFPDTFVQKAFRYSGGLVIRLGGTK